MINVEQKFQIKGPTAEKTTPDKIVSTMQKITPVERVNLSTPKASPITPGKSAGISQGARR